MQFVTVSLQLLVQNTANGGVDVWDGVVGSVRVSEYDGCVSVSVYDGGVSVSGYDRTCMRVYWYSECV